MQQLDLLVNRGQNQFQNKCHTPFISLLPHSYLAVLMPFLPHLTFSSAHMYIYMQQSCLAAISTIDQNLFSHGKGMLDRELFFPPWNQVDLIFEKSGQPFYGALEFQIGAQKRN